MIPVMQKPYDGMCFCACVASILEYDLSDMPDLPLNGEDSAPLWDELRGWLVKQGYDLVWASGGLHYPPMQSYWIASGDSPTCGDVEHAVVMRGEGMAHDPHPGKIGITSATNAYLLVKRENNLGDN